MEYMFNNVNEAFCVLWNRMWSDPVIERVSRNGPVREALGPVMITYKRPRERVLLLPGRDANPFFHLFEAIWMLAGRNELYWLKQFNAQMAAFSDDGNTISGSDYGRRWREVLPAVLQELRRDSNTRRAYIPLFHPDDNERMFNTKDLPCNTGIAFMVYDGLLNMTVFNRSNDMIWGSLGANYVHFGFFQEYMATLCDLEVGHLNQISSNFHMYEDFPITKKIKETGVPPHFDPYKAGVCDASTTRIIHSRTDDAWQEDAKFFINEFTSYSVDWQKDQRWWNDPFFPKLAVPMFRAWKTWRTEQNLEEALLHIDRIVGASDWALGGKTWLKTQARKRDAKAKSNL
jgi:thymidylate synthase